ncbi:hypothetical protein EV138_2680 [Kribbella voronezhensis]|uniref:Uncharacterized protein n=1 Tax=Kribbella voronezhensis TaxID=2512212 RepID=A0A4R7TAZ0_9ACTN|nr:hypothetical protein [Kribbella voronezhensis]TDU89125.1 hypothetical protein EV138_2680 [Kribbella voronezhensis]
MKSPSARSPVFVDSTGRRHRRIRRTGAWLAVPAAGYVILLVSSLLGGPRVDTPLIPLPEAGKHQPEKRVTRPAATATTTPKPGEPTRSTEPTSTPTSADRPTESAPTTQPTATPSVTEPTPTSSATPTITPGPPMTTPRHGKPTAPPGRTKSPSKP